MTAQRSVCIIGSGNWGSTIARVIGHNLPQLSNFDNKVKMWVFEELWEGQKLSEVINKTHTNPKYLPGINLGENVVAVPDLVEACKNADVLVFVLPHQFLQRACDSLKGNLKPGAYGISLIKGLYVSPSGGVGLLSDMIRTQLGIDCAVLMGANLAPEVAAEQFCETTIGCLDESRGKELKSLFQANYFRITVTLDEAATELCGALKNIVALAAGFVDGLGLGGNTKAAVIRLGFIEMKSFIYKFFSDRHISEGTFTESCGIADVMTSCYGGRNRKVGEAFAKSKGDTKIEDVEAEILNGQSAQGILTAYEVNEMLSKHNAEDSFPLFTIVKRCCKGEYPVVDFLKSLEDHPEHR